MLLDKKDLNYTVLDCFFFFLLNIDIFKYNILKYLQDNKITYFITNL